MNADAGTVSLRVAALLERREQRGEPSTWERLAQPLGETRTLYRCNRHGVEFEALLPCPACHAPPKRPAWLEVPDYWIAADGHAYDPSTVAPNMHPGLVIVHRCAADRMTCEWHPWLEFAPDEVCEPCWQQYLDEQYVDNGVLMNDRGELVE